MPTPSFHSSIRSDTTRVSTSARPIGQGDWNELARLPVLERAIRACPDRYFVTLTSRRSLTSGGLSTEVGKVLHKVNAKLFGTHYSRKKAVRLATFTVQELTCAEGLHAHLLIGVPEGSLALKANPAAMEVGRLMSRNGSEPTQKLAERTGRTAGRSMTSLERPRTSAKASAARKRSTMSICTTARCHTCRLPCRN